MSKQSKQVVLPCRSAKHIRGAVLLVDPRYGGCCAGSGSGRVAGVLEAESYNNEQTNDLKTPTDSSETTVGVPWSSILDVDGCCFIFLLWSKASQFCRKSSSSNKLMFLCENTLFDLIMLKICDPHLFIYSVWSNNFFPGWWTAVFSFRLSGDGARERYYIQGALSESK